MNKNNTKRNLLMSVLSLLLCCSMLIGSTFAWFTDSATSGNNVITSGNLDVEVKYTLDGKTWNDLDGATDLFQKGLWEPGHTEVVALKISNKGSLALKYTANMNIVNETVGKTKNGNEIILSDILTVSTLTQQANDEAGIGDLSLELAYLGEGYLKYETATSFKTGNVLKGEQELGVDTEHYLFVKVDMPETVGNEANHDGVNVPSINFGINVLATQFPKETDSFGPTYDEGLTPLEDGDLLIEEDHIQYIYKEDGNVILYLVGEDYKDETVRIKEGTTQLGNYAFAYNSNVKKVILPSTVNSLGRGFDSSSVEKVVLNEGLEKIDSRAFRSTKNLKEVVIPSTIKVIEDNAFQKSAIKSIVIPATVETIGEAAFGSSLIEEVTFKGNTAIQGYAFRGCTKLTKVTLEGDDVTFIPSTLNGRNSMWFCNGESNNPNTSKIDFYVVNETVKERVLTAMGAERNNTKVFVNGMLVY